MPESTIPRRFCRRFALTELIIVVAILALLSAMVVTAAGNRDGSGEAAVCLNNLKEIGRLAAAYAADHNGFMPMNTASNTVSANGVRHQWFCDLDPYISHRPTDNTADLDAVFRCPAQKSLTIADYSRYLGTNYRYNVFLGHPSWKKDGYYRHRNLRDCLRPAVIGVVIDAKWDVPKNPDRFSTQSWDTEFTITGQNNLWNYYKLLHNDLGNVLYVDGHASAENLGRLSDEDLRYFGRFGHGGCPVQIW